MPHVLLLLSVAEALARNFSSQFLTVLLSGTFPCLPTLKYVLNIRCVVITQSLFFKNASTAIARSTNDQ